MRIMNVRHGISPMGGLGVLLASALLVSACVGAGSADAGDDPSAAGRDGSAELTVLSQFGDNPALQEVLDDLNSTYEREHPDVSVEIEYLTLDDLTKTVPTKLASGSGPDIIDYDANESSLGELATNGLLTPLDEDASRYGWSGGLAESVLARTQYDGQLFGVGRSSEAVGLFYNQDIFEQHGVREPETYEDFLAAADAFRDTDVTPIAFGNKDQWPSSHLIGAALHAAVPLETIQGFETLSGTGAWTSPEVVEALGAAREWVEQGYLTPNFNGVSFDDALGEFSSGQAAMFIEGTGVTPDLLADMDAPVRFVPFPMIDPALPQQAQGGVGGAWAISAASPAPDVAADWIDFVHFSPEAEAAWFRAGVLPTTDYDGAGVEVPDLARDNLDVVRAAQEGGGIGYWTGFATSPLVTDAWNAGAQQLLDGQLDATSFAQGLQEALDQARAAAP
jgi:ABC-type glycerol-3-phosphate transport system substrate-binding protein